MLKLLKKWLGMTPAQDAPEPMDMLRKTGSHRTLKPSIAPPVVKPRPQTPPVSRTEAEDESGINEKPIDLVAQYAGCIWRPRSLLCWGC